PERGRSMHPSTSTHPESKIAARHVQFEFEPNLDISEIRDVEGNQVRLSEHRAPKAIVDRYAEQMKAGAIFPAIVVNDRHEIVDGNSRWMAARRNKRETIAAYVCYDLSALQARSLSVELNQSHGLSMTEDEIRAFVTSAVEEGQVLDAKAYSRMTGTKSSTLTRWVAVKHFEMRASRHGMTTDYYQRLSDSARAALQVAKLSSVFVQVTALAIDARVPSAQLKSIITEANAAPSEVDSLAVVARAREDRSDDIKAIAAGFKGARRKSTGSALHIGRLLRFEVADLLDVPHDKRAEMFTRMSSLRQRLDGALSRARDEWNIVDHIPPTGLDDQVRPHNLAQVN
ncbi:MAG: ParB N-terminal domain-containing protein, partial [Gammaproteobacteria bacterium]